MPLPISGANIVSIGYTITLSDGTPDGTWTSSNTAVATVDASGIVTGKALGAATITYTVDSAISTKVIAVQPVNISNGYNLNDLFPVFQKRLGWLPSTLGDAPVLSEDNATSYSGRYYNDNSFHTAITLDNLKAVQEDSAITDDNFNALLQTLDKSVITRVANSVFKVPALIEHRLAFTRTYNCLNAAIPNGGNFVGHRLNIAPGNYAMQINAISLYFNGDVAFNLYLFNDLVLQPVYTKQVSATANSQTRIQLDWVYNYINTQNLGGVVYVGYFQNDLGGVQALDEQYNIWSNTGTFGGYPFQTQATGGTTFNRVNPSVVYRTYGLNMEVTMYRDYTHTIIQCAHLFDDARGLAMAIIVLSVMKYNTRSNTQERDITNFLQQYAVDVDHAYPTQEVPIVAGLKAQYAKALKQISQAIWPDVRPVSLNVSDAMYGENWEYLGMPLNNLPLRQGLR